MPEPKTLLVFRPSYDLATKYLATYAGKLVDEAIGLGYTVVDLYGADATKLKLEQAVSLHEPALIGLFSHGNYELLAGQNSELVLDACVNDQILSGKEVLAVSCRTARVLGPSARSKTCVGYFGWQEDFMFVANEAVSNPLDDIYAESFFESALVPMVALLQGGTLWQAYDKTVNTFNSWIAYWRASSDSWAPQVVTTLYWDRDNFLLLTSGVIPKRAAINVSSLLILGIIAAPLFLGAKS